MITTAEIFAEIERFPHLSITMFGGEVYADENGSHKWDVELAWRSDNKTQVRVRGQGDSIDTAFFAVWTTLTDLADLGFSIKSQSQVAGKVDDHDD